MAKFQYTTRDGDYGSVEGDYMAVTPSGNVVIGLYGPFDDLYDGEVIAVFPPTYKIFKVQESGDV